MALATYTGNTPNRATGAETFSADTDYYHSYFTPFISQFNTEVLGVQNNTNIALAAANAAAAAPPIAPAWVSGQTYVVGYPVYSILTKLVYRRVIAGAGTTDPSLDITNWVPSTLSFTPAYHT
jgi:hypothetical protein